MVLAISIVKRGVGAKITTFYKNNGVLFNCVLLGKGTANSEMLNLLGLGGTEKDIVFSTMVKDISQAVIFKAEKKFKLKQNGEGMIFTVPISSVGGPITYRIMAGMIGKGNE